MTVTLGELNLKEIERTLVLTCSRIDCINHHACERNLTPVRGSVPLELRQSNDGRITFECIYFETREV
jgi:hypothetical protein